MISTNCIELIALLRRVGAESPKEERIEGRDEMIISLIPFADAMIISDASKSRVSYTGERIVSNPIVVPAIPILIDSINGDKE